MFHCSYDYPHRTDADGGLLLIDQTQLGGMVKGSLVNTVQCTWYKEELYQEYSKV